MTTPRKIRAYVEIPVSPIDTEQAIRYAMTVTNISLTGCIMIMDQGLEVGTPISFSIPQQNGKMLELQGAITREQGEPHGYGISCDTLADEQRRELALLIASSEET